MTFNLIEKIKTTFNNNVTIPMRCRDLGDVLLEDAASRMPTFKLIRVRNALKNGARAENKFTSNKPYPDAIDGMNFFEASVYLKNQAFIIYDLAQNLPLNKPNRYAETLANSSLDVPTMNVAFRIISNKYADFNLVNEEDKTTLTDRLKNSINDCNSTVGKKRLGYIIESVKEHGGLSYDELMERNAVVEKIRIGISKAKASRATSL